MADNDKTLLAHLAWRFPGATEDVATEALAYILIKEEGARVALRDLLREAGGDLASIASASTQRVYRRTMRPDLVAFNEGNHEIALVESKFWATTTPNQPNGYLRLMKEDLPYAKSLLFLAPSARQGSLWTELRQRAQLEFVVGDMVEAGGVRGAAVGRGGCRMMQTSWAVLLDRIAGSIGESVELAQLRGLCAWMESGPPVDASGKNLDQVAGFETLINVAVQRAQAPDRGYVNTDGLRVGLAYGKYGRYFRFVSGDKRLGVARLGVDLERSGAPLFLWFTEYTPTHIQHVRLALKGVIDDGNCVAVPLPDGDDFQTAVEAVVARLKEIRDRLASSE